MGVGRAFSKRRSRIVARMRRNARSGSAAIEFAVIAPVLFLFLCGIIETGILFFASSALQSATDDIARLIRTGQLSGTLDAVSLKADICNQITGLVSAQDCKNNLQVDLHAYNNFSGAAYPNVVNPDGSLNTGAMSVQTTGDCQVVLMRSFYPWTIMTPMMTTLLSDMPNGQHLLAAAAAFRTEPYVAGAAC